VLRDLDDEVVRLIVDGRVGDREGGVDLGQVGAAELDVDDGADDLDDSALLIAGRGALDVFLAAIRFPSTPW
jgi:hypothetical protein